MSGVICGDNRFEIIEKAKKAVLDSTNINTSPDEMKDALAEGLMRAESLHLIGEKQRELPEPGILGEICATGAPIYTHDGPPAREPVQFGCPQPDIHSQDIKKQLKAVLRANGMYVGSSKAATLLRELADEYDD